MAQNSKETFLNFRPDRQMEIKKKPIKFGFDPQTLECYYVHEQTDGRMLNFKVES